MSEAAVLLFSPLDALSESYIPDVLLVLLRGVSAEKMTRQRTDRTTAEHKLR